MKKKLITIVGIIYVILAAFVTKFLLDKNEFGVFETKNNYYVYSDELDNYSKSSLVRFEKNINYNDLINEKVYFFNEEKKIKSDVLKSIDDNGAVFTINETKYNIANLLGKPNNSYVFLGTLLNILTSKVFYLLFIIVPMAFLLIFEIYLFVIYIRNSKDGKDSNNAKIVDKSA